MSRFYIVVEEKNRIKAMKKFKKWFHKIKTTRLSAMDWYYNNHCRTTEKQDNCRICISIKHQKSN